MTPSPFYDRDFEKALFNALAIHGPCVRKVLVKELARPRSTIHDYLKRLEKKGEVVRRPDNVPGQIGHPFVLWDIIEHWEVVEK